MTRDRQDADTTTDGNLPPPGGVPADAHTHAAGGVLRRKRAPQFLPAQRAWIADESPAKLAYKSRRTGWTFAEAYDAVSRRQRRTQPRDADYWFSSADESAGQEFIEYCAYWSQRLFGAIADRYTDEIEDERTRRSGTAHVIRCRNGRRITAMTSNPRRFRSKGGDVALDEFGHHDDAAAMYEAAQPATLWGGTLRVFGTPNGEGAELHNLAMRCEKVLRALGHDPHAVTHCDVDYETLERQADALGVRPVMSYHRVTIAQAVGEGLVELLNRTRGTALTREGFVARLRRQCRSEEHFQQEYLCTPAAASAAVLKYALIEACQDAECPGVQDCSGRDAAPPRLVGYRGGALVIGVDVGRSQDPSVAWACEAVGDVLWTRAVARMDSTSLVDQQTVIEALLRAGRVARVVILRQGMGVGLFDHLSRRHGAAIAAIDESRPAKLGLVGGILQAFEDRRVRVPLDDGLREQLHAVREVRTPGGQVSSWPRSWTPPGLPAAR